MNDGKIFSKFDLNVATPVVGWEASGTSPMKNPLRLILHTFDGFFAEFAEIAKNIYGIPDASFGFASKEEERNYKREGIRPEYVMPYNEKFNEAVDTFFNKPEVWTDKQIEQLAIFTTCFQMERFMENYLTLWKKYVPSFQKAFEGKA
jgi:glucan phosphorylase